MEFTMDDYLIQTCHEAFCTGHYKVAYHLLCAALQHGLDTGSIAYLEAVQKLAREQSLWIDVNGPDNRQSLQSVMDNQGFSLFYGLYRQLESDLKTNRIRDKQLM
jgi:hypothetical protein